MASSRAKILFGAGAALVVLWGLSTLSSHWLLASHLEKLVADPPPGSHWRLSDLSEDSGILASSGSFNVAWQVPASVDSGGHAVPVGRLQYHVSHILLPTSLQRFDWTFVPDASSGSVLGRSFGPLPPMSGAGVVGPTGRWITDFDVPALTNATAGRRMTATASRMHVDAGHDSLAFVWRLSHIVSHDSAGTTSLDGVELSASLPDEKPAHGEFALSINRATTPSGGIDGARIVAGARLAGDTIAWHVRPSALAVHVNGQTLSDLAMEIEISGLPLRPTDDLVALFSDPRDPDRMTAADRQRFRNALAEVLAHGFSIGMPELKGSFGSGAVASHVTVALLPGEARTDSGFDRRIRSSGELSLKGATLPPQTIRAFVASGYATEMPGGLVARYDYANGALTLNGRPVDASGMNAWLGERSIALQAALRVPASAPVESAERRAAPAAPMSGQAKTAVPPGSEPAMPPVVANPAPTSPTAVAEKPASGMGTTGVKPVVGDSPEASRVATVAVPTVGLGRDATAFTPTPRASGTVVPASAAPAPAAADPVHANPPVRPIAPRVRVERSTAVAAALPSAAAPLAATSTVPDLVETTRPAAPSTMDPELQRQEQARKTAEAKRKLAEKWAGSP